MGSDRKNDLNTLKIIRHIFLTAFLTKLFELMINLVNQLFFTWQKMQSILKQYHYYQIVIKKHFSQNLVLSEKDDQRFQSSNKYWIYNKLFDIGDSKVRDHCHVQSCLS